MINYNIAVKQIKYKVGIYIRLSREDVLRQEESLSVINQKNILQSYVYENNYELYNIYIDDGFTGTNFDRPAFKELIRDIEYGKINMVITKDLSRLGRDYIETGKYIEKYFPTHNVRYVALLDGIDTVMDNSNNDIAPFKAVINDMYSRDNSKKIRSALKSMQLKGKWVGGCIPFGYMKDPQDKNHLIINEEEAKIVRNIFKYAKTGMNYYQIAEKLTSDNVPTSSMLRDTNRKGKMAILGIWSTKTIKGILSNQLYLGDMVQNKNSRISYKIRKNVKNSKDNWIIVSNTHEPLVDRETFNSIQKILANCKVRSKKQIHRSLDGLLYCYDCGHKITICSPNRNGYTYTVCNYYRMYSKKKICTSHSFNYDKLENLVLNELKKMLMTSLDYKDILERVKKIYNNEIVLKSKTLINEINSLINSKEMQLDKMYLDKLDGKITNEMYDRIRIKIMDDIDKLKNNKILKGNDYTNGEEVCNKIVNDFFNLTNLSRFIILHLIDKIVLHNDKQIDIHLSFSN